jgi:hypothetical protein
MPLRRRRLRGWRSCSRLLLYRVVTCILHQRLHEPRALLLREYIVLRFRPRKDTKLLTLVIQPFAQNNRKLLIQELGYTILCIFVILLQSRINHHEAFNKVQVPLL